LLLRRSHRRAAFTALAASIGMGLAMGVARMAAGGHFASDVLWSGYLVFLVNWLLYYFVLRIPQIEDGRPVRRTLAVHPGLRIAAGLIMGAGLLYALLLTLPLDEELRFAVRREQAAGPHAVSIVADHADVIATLVRQADPVLHLEGHVHGLGLPGNRVESAGTWDAGPGMIRYSLRHVGIFTARDTHINVSIEAAALTNLVVRLGTGNIYIKTAMPLPPDMVIDAATGHGQVLLPPR